MQSNNFFYKEYRLLCVIAVVAGAIGLSGGSDTEVIYKETTVKYGTLVKGVTESGSVDIGTKSFAKISFII